MFSFFLSFRSRVANLVSVSILVFNCTELPFERYIVKWSQLSFLLSFPIGNSKFNPKGDIILFVVCGDIQVQEKLFKILILPQVTIQKLIPSVLQFNIHNDQGVAKSYNFKVDAIISSCSLPIFALHSNVSNNKNKIYLVFLVTRFAVGMSVETFKSKKSCSKS